MCRIPGPLRNVSPLRNSAIPGGTGAAPLPMPDTPCAGSGAVGYTVRVRKLVFIIWLPGDGRQFLSGQAGAAVGLDAV